MVAQRLCCLLGATTVCLVAIASCTEDLSTRGASLTSREVTTLALTGLEREQAAQLVSFPIVRCITPTSAGTAVVLGPDTLIMTRHQLGKLYYEVNGVLTSLEVLESSSAPDDDWAVVRACPSVTTEAAWTEPERSIGVGQAIFLIGYWGKKELGTSPWTWSHVANLPRTIVKGRVVAPPKHLGLEELPPDEHFIYCDTPCAQLFAGLSGGAAVVWDERAARFVLIGIYCGVAYVRAEDGSLLFAAQLVRRLPPSALDRRDAPAKPARSATWRWSSSPQGEAVSAPDPDHQLLATSLWSRCGPEGASVERGAEASSLVPGRALQRQGASLDRLSDDGASSGRLQTGSEGRHDRRFWRWLVRGQVRENSSVTLPRPLRDCVLIGRGADRGLPP